MAFSVEEMSDEVSIGSSISVEEIEVEPTGEYIYDDEDFSSAMDLMSAAKQMLGFYGDTFISGTIVQKDRKRMIELADNIQNFLDSIKKDE